MTWVNKSLNEICENLDSKRVPITKSKRISGRIPYYGASGIVNYVDGYLFNEDLLLVSEDGANLLARTYPIAFSISGKTWVNNHAHVLKFEKTEKRNYVEYYLNSISLKPYVSGMAQPKLNQKSLNNIQVTISVSGKDKKASSPFSMRLLPGSMRRLPTPKKISPMPVSCLKVHPNLFFRMALIGKRKHLQNC